MRGGPTVEHQHAVDRVALLTFLSPTLGYRLFSYVAVLGLFASVPQIFWLLAFGVDEQRWKEQAAGTAKG